MRVIGKPVTGIASGIGYVFQADALLPWKTCSTTSRRARFRGVRKKEAQRARREWIARVGLTGFDDHYPHQLSGGMRKRVALAAEP